MLKQRVITALVLLAVLLPTLFATPAWPFALLTLIGFSAALALAMRASRFLVASATLYCR